MCGRRAGVRIRLRIRFTGEFERRAEFEVVQNDNNVGGRAQSKTFQKRKGRTADINPQPSVDGRPNNRARFTYVMSDDDN